ncbi:ferrochelatase [Arsenophonus symbiont of Ornithomya chloropus]|uniref:ferrochelatase n=1 Tax=Arsenophonus symbiont of Ornithomya chloropus TaxID=634121 RepID=UPI0032B2FE4A
MTIKKHGVLLVNLGTPVAPKSLFVKRFLIDFLSDSRVVDLSKIIWSPLLYLLIVPLRLSKLVKFYQSIWTKDGSPLLYYSEEQKKALSRRLSDIPVEIGMTYGFPSVSQAINKLLIKNINNMIVLPLYPQYSSTTTAAVFDAISLAFKKYRTIPGLNFIRSYANHPYYLNALKKSIQLSFFRYGIPDRLLFSYHGIPKRYVESGDIYPQECKLTTFLLSKLINFPSNKIIMTYQSRFGWEAWLEPYTDITLKNLAKNGVRHVQLLCPGFSVDCLETLIEIAVDNKKIFYAAGGKKYFYIPALNALDSHIILMQELISSYI